MSFCTNSEYKYIYKSDFNPNISFLSKIYAPFISKDAFCLYSFMCEELRNFNTTKFFKNKLDEIKMFLDLNDIELENAKANLEALGLLKTYLSEDKKVYFELFEPLKFKDFFNNPLFKKNIEEKLGKEVVSKLCSQYDEIVISDNLQEITIDAEEFFVSNDFIKTTTFDFDNLFENIAKTTKFYIEIDDDVKSDIDYYYKKFKLTNSEIEKCIYSSVVKENNNYRINRNLMLKELNDLVDKSIENLDEVVKLNHNKKMFIEKFSLNDLNTIFKNYKNFSSEQFFTALTYEKVTDNDIEIISTLRKKYFLPDCFINLMIDFSIRKTHGVLNSKYLYKMAKSFKLENIESLYDAYEFLFNWDSKKTKSINNKKDDVKTNTTTSNFKEEQDLDFEFNSNSNDEEIVYDNEDLIFC